MSKKPIKVYLDTETLTKLKGKAEALGFEGRGWLSNYLTKIANQPLIVLDDNLKQMLRALDLR